MIIGELCNRDVVIIEPNESIDTAAQLMRRHHTGDLIVVDNQKNRKPVGIVTDRDLVIEVLAVSLDYSKLSVGDIMSDQLATASELESLTDVLQRMSDKGVRRMPVVNELGRIEGIFTLDDFIDVLSDQTRLAASLIRNEQVKERDRRT